MARDVRARPRRRLPIPNLRATALSLMVLLGLGAYASYLFVPDVTNMADDVIRMVRDRFTPPAPAVPVAFEGRAAPGHGAADAFDSDNSATYWLSATRSGEEPRLRVSFGDTVDLRRIEILGGAPGDDYGVYARPRTIALQTPGRNQRISLSDTPDVQPLDIDVTVPEGEPLHIIVLDTFPGQRSDDTAIRNIVFGTSS
jgi:hypothetical protein